MSLNGFGNAFLNGMKILFGIVFGPLALFLFNELIWSLVSCNNVGKRKIRLFFPEELFSLDNAIIYFFSNAWEKVIKIAINLFFTFY